MGSAVGLAAMVAVAAAHQSGPAEAADLLPGFKAAFSGAAIVAVAGAALAVVGLRSSRAGMAPAE